MPAATKAKTSETSLSPPSDEARAAEGTSYADELAELKEKLDAAITREIAARREVTTSSYASAREVTFDLVKFRDDIDFKRSDAPSPEDRPARERELTEKFLDAVREKGLTVAALGGSGGAVALIDPNVHREYNEARAEAPAIEKQIKQFEADHEADLESERKAADAARIKAALAGDDGDAIREVLAPPETRGGGAMTTADLPGVHKRHPVYRG